MATKWTDLFIRKLEARATRYDLREGDGFTVRVSPTGTKTFYFLFTLHGRKRRLFLGEYDTNATDPKGRDPDADPMPYKGLVSLKRARSRHTTALSIVRAGADPVEMIEREEAAVTAQREAEEASRAAECLAPTVGKLVDLYLEKWAKPNKRSWQEDERQLKKDLVPAIGTLKARDVTRGHIRAILDTVVERGAPVAANRLLAVVQRVLAWAADKEIR